VHLCQTLFRNHADGLSLLGWLRERIWPLEAALDGRSLRLSARLGIAELLLGGTTSVLDMATVRHTDEVYAAALESGMRYVGGKALMDAGEGVPAALRDETGAALAEAEALGARWDGADGGRIRACLAPRFVLAATPRLLQGVAALSARRGWIVHTHAAESEEEVRAVRAATGAGAVELLGRAGLVTRRLAAAHCVHLGPGEAEALARAGATAVHCPGSNLKLGSGVAPVPELLARGVNVALGADGAACNNTLDVFHEMRLAATLPATRLSPGCLAPSEVLALATVRGARALSMEEEIGAVEPGKRADLAVVDLDRPHLCPRGEDLHATLVHAARASDVTDVLVDGRHLVRAGRLLSLDAPALVRAASAGARRVLARAGLRA
jgi:cytosine/adenosine deaminase-related metal-dependent hydrolase